MDTVTDTRYVLLAASESTTAEEIASQLADEDDRLTVTYVTDAEAGMKPVEQGAVDCVVVTAGFADGKAIDFISSICERVPDLPVLYYIDETTETNDASTLIERALDAGAIDVVEARTDNSRVSLLVHRLSNAIEAGRANAEAKRQQERVDQFVSGVSHDLRNPLNVAQGRLSLARDSNESENLVIAASAVDRTLELIADLLTLAKQGEKPKELEWVDLSRLVEESWRNVATGDATLVIETDQRIRAHPSRLKQLLENLIGNAIDHGGESVTVVVGSVSPIYTTTRADGSLPAGFYVADDGPGIPKAERERVFETGYTTGNDGTGFGLNIVQEVATAHGWDVQISDSVGGGARFDITGVEAES